MLEGLPVLGNLELKGPRRSSQRRPPRLRNAAPALAKQAPVNLFGTPVTEPEPIEQTIV